jgi:hypothetical protein
VDGDGGDAEVLRNAGLVERVDSSAILPDSVSHMCVFAATERLRRATSDSGRWEVLFVPRKRPDGLAQIRIRTFVAQLDSIDGIQQADNAVEASADLRVVQVPTEWGKRLGETEIARLSDPIRVRFDRYDDGWRLRRLR